MSSPTALPALPGASHDPGSGPIEPALLDDLLDDAGGLRSHRALLTSDHRDLVAAIVLPAESAATAEFRRALAPGDSGIRVVLAASGPDPLAGLRGARTVLLDADAVEFVGVRLAAPGDVRDLLAALDSSAPAWITVPPGETAGPVIDVLVEDGAENATLDLATGDHPALADVLRRLVDRDLSFRVAGSSGVLAVGGPGGAPGALNLLCATRAALNGAEIGELAEILAARQAAPLTSALRRMSVADAAVLRAFLVAIEVPDAGTAAADLADLGLLPAG